ncbi:MAG: hypothetical protein LBS85_08210 [Clostridiales Family XIII bacterium]|jgi:hypothetical protein|nr:hypothetical protein [Clostridiales Family XIII bacterium]
MKQFIVLMAMIALGVFIYQCIAGPDGSILESLRALWQHELMRSPFAAGGGGA